MKYGYARVSTTDQDLTIQRNALNAYGCDMVRGERASGTSTDKRHELRSILDFIRQGDTLVVTRVDRLARSMGDLQDIVRELRSKGASLVMTEQQIDTSTPAGKAFLDMLGVFAEFETNLRADRQREGIARARAEDRYRGHRARPPKMDPAIVLAKVQELGAAKAARALNLGARTVYDYMQRDDKARKVLARNQPLA
jgi:DNA invertase Pin-like site-specific DNA recombinase